MPRAENAAMFNPVPYYTQGMKNILHRILGETGMQSIPEGAMIPNTEAIRDAALQCYTFLAPLEGNKSLVRLAFKTADGTPWVPQHELEGLSLGRLVELEAIMCMIRNGYEDWRSNIIDPSHLRWWE